MEDVIVYKPCTVMYLEPAINLNSYIDQYKIIGARMFQNKSESKPFKALYCCMGHFMLEFCKAYGYSKKISNLLKNSTMEDDEKKIISSLKAKNDMLISKIMLSSEENYAPIIKFMRQLISNTKFPKDVDKIEQLSTILSTKIVLVDRTYSPKDILLGKYEQSIHNDGESNEIVFLILRNTTTDIVEYGYCYQKQILDTGMLQHIQNQEAEIKNPYYLLERHIKFLFS